MHIVLALINPKECNLLGLFNYLFFDLKELINAVTAVTKPVIAIINPANASILISIGDTLLKGLRKELFYV
jgi:hypothetical protein